MSTTTTSNLVVVSEKSKGQTCAVGVDRETVIGRTDDCGVCLQDNRISRRHCVISAGPTGFAVKDLNSANGTFVNGRRVTESPLCDGDRVKVGFTELEFHTDALFPGNAATPVAPAQMPTEPIIAPAAPRNRISTSGAPKIYFCTRCAVSIPPAEMSSGRARAIDGQLFCPDCLVSDSTSVRALRAVESNRRAPTKKPSVAQQRPRVTLPEAAPPPKLLSKPATRPSGKSAPAAVVSARAAVKAAIASTAVPAPAPAEEPAVAPSKRLAAERPTVPLRRQLWAYGSFVVTVLLIALCAVQLPGAWLNFQKVTSPSRIAMESIAPDEAQRGFFTITLKDTLKAEDGREVKATQSAGIIARMQYDGYVQQAKALPNGVATVEIVYDKKNPLRSAIRDQLFGIPTLLIFLIALAWAVREMWQISKFYRRPALAPARVPARK